MRGPVNRRMPRARKPPPEPTCQVRSVAWNVYRQEIGTLPDFGGANGHGGDFDALTGWPFVPMGRIDVGFLQCSASPWFLVVEGGRWRK